MPDAILTLNSGSSSIKFALYERTRVDALQLALRGEIVGIGATPHFTAHDLSGRSLADKGWPDAAPDFGALLDTILAFAESHLGRDSLAAVGHRVVHGGPIHYRPERVTPDLLAELHRLTPLAPLHQPHNLAPISLIAEKRPTLPQVACFDTGFHHSMPAVATRFALPRNFEAEGVRRYGFHGLSYEYIARRLKEISPDLAKGRVIAAHLGNGASLCAMRDGRSIDTTMGLTALDGLAMGTRCGSLDPGVILYLEKERGLSADEIEHILYEKSGLLGVSGGLASDMRTLLASTDPRAADAVELFVFRIVREIGALTSSLGGLDGLIFTAGIGEHAPEIRRRVCARLGWLGVALDSRANARGEPVVSIAASKVTIHVLPTDEEATIARHTSDIIGGAADHG
jgi:acetate kinase